MEVRKSAPLSMCKNKLTEHFFIMKFQYERHE